MCVCHCVCCFVHGWSVIIHLRSSRQVRVYKGRHSSSRLCPPWQNKTEIRDRRTSWLECGVSNGQTDGRTRPKFLVLTWKWFMWNGNAWVLYFDFDFIPFRPLDLDGYCWSQLTVRLFQISCGEKGKALSLSLIDWVYAWHSAAVWVSTIHFWSKFFAIKRTCPERLSLIPFFTVIPLYPYSLINSHVFSKDYSSVLLHVLNMRVEKQSGPVPAVSS